MTEALVGNVLCTIFEKVYDQAFDVNKIHIPIEEYRENLEIYSRFHPIEDYNGHRSIDEEDNRKKNFEIDRLMDGLAVIPEDGSAPVLLVDTQQSLMKDLYDARQVMVREYSIDK